MFKMSTMFNKVVSSLGFFLVMMSTPIFSQGELRGTIIYNDRCNETSKPVANAFDNDLNTYFHSCAPFGNWIGLDLREAHIITKVAYAPRMDADYRDRLQLGIFEGANQADFGDAIALAIIPGLTERKLNELTVSSSLGFRYVRFIFPYSQINGKSSYMGELKFYGYKGEGDYSKLPQLTNIPTISIRTVDAQDITSKEVYVQGVISIVYADGAKFFSDSLGIRGRGNNSWTHPKKPYRLKLAKSTRLMGLPAKAKNWTLINNYGDKTLMRNMLAFDFSRRLEMPYTSPAEAVDVVLNGDYKGTYNLSDQIDVRENRVDIEEMETTDLSGGYLIEIDAYAKGDPKNFTSRTYNIPVSIKYPDDKDITLSQEQYIANHFNKLVESVASNQYRNPETGYGKYLNLEAFVRHFLVGEYSGNTDTYWSVRMSKRRDEDKFNFGPVWDFDLGFENDHRTYSITDWANRDNEWVGFSNRSSGAGETKTMIKRILSDPFALSQLERTYAHYRYNNVISKEILTAKVDELAEMLDQTQQLNFKRWNIMLVKVHENPVIHGSYKAEVENVRDFIADRIDWMDSKLNYDPAYNPDTSSSDTKNRNDIKVRTSKNTIILQVARSSFIEIFDVFGKLVVAEHVNDNGSLNVNVNSGAYIIRVLDNNNQQSVIKCLL